MSTSSSAPSRQILLDLFFSVLRIRRVQEALAARYDQWQMRCPIHLCIGQEAVASGVCKALTKKDVVFSNHRSHGHYLAKGGNLKKLIAELYGKETGCASGFGGSMHLIDRRAGFLGSTPIVAGTVPLAVGAAWALSMKKKDSIAAAFFGDGCFEEGAMHESLIFGALKKLPILFVCENNGYSVYTPLEERQPDRPIYKIAQAHGWEASSANGDDVLEVYIKTTRAVERLRSGGRPQFLEFSTHRWREHCGPNEDDQRAYRGKDELPLWKKHCPVAELQNQLTLKKILTPGLLASFENRIRREIEAAFRFAEQSAFPPRRLAERIYASS